MGTFTEKKNTNVAYSFEAALCIDNGCLFPVVAKSKFNKQAYIFKGELVSLLRIEKKDPNPYILCYKRRSSEQ